MLYYKNKTCIYIEHLCDNSSWKWLDNWQHADIYLFIIVFPSIKVTTICHWNIFLCVFQVAKKASVLKRRKSSKRKMDSDNASKENVPEMDEQTSNNEKNDIKSGTGGKLIFSNIFWNYIDRNCFIIINLAQKTMQL